MNIRSHLTVALLLVGATVIRSAPDSSATAVDPAAIEHALETAIYQVDTSGKDAAKEVAAIDALSAQLDAGLAKDPRNGRLRYAKGLAEFAAAVPYRTAKDSANVKARLEAAAKQLDQVQGNPWEAEAAALEGFVYLQLMSTDRDSAMDLAPKEAQLFQKANNKLPHSPRVMLFQGLGFWMTPADFGGDPDKGLSLLEAAEKVFRQEADAKGTNERPVWGRAYALGWQGTMLKKKGDTAGAEAVWKQALSLEPDYRMVKRLIASLHPKKKADQPSATAEKGKATESASAP